MSIRTLCATLVAATLMLVSSSAALAGEVYALRNYWKATQYISFLSQTLGTGPKMVYANPLGPQPDNKMMWEREKAGTESGKTYYRLRNLGNNRYMHIEKGSLDLTDNHHGWHSAQWYFEPKEGDWLIRNRWKSDIYLHIEHGKLEASRIDKGWHSARWRLERMRFAEDFRWLDANKKPDGTMSEKDAPERWIRDVTWDWMYKISDQTQLRDISIPGTHDSGARRGVNSCRTQSWSIAEQLDAGIRFVDIRLRRSGSSFTIHHGLCYMKMNFTDVMKSVTNFLNKHPSEVVMMRVQEEHTPAGGSKSFREIWDDYMKTYGDYFVGELSTHQRLSSLRGKIVLLDASPDKDLGLGYKWQDSGVMTVQDKYTIRYKDSDRYSGITLDRKKELITEYIGKSRTSNKLTINHLSATGLGSGSGKINQTFGMRPDAVAKETNQHAYDVIGGSSGKRRVGVLVMDYPGERLIYRIISTNFSN